MTLGEPAGRYLQALRRDARQVYGQQGEEVARSLERLARSFREAHPRDAVPPERRMTANDTILISYADSIRNEAEPPLRTLARWLAGPLSDTVSTVHLLPFYPWSSDDGFAVRDYRAVEPSYGDWDDVHALAKDHRLMFDAVVNHASAQGAWFDGFLRDQEPWRSWFRTEAEHADVASIVRPRTTPLLTPFDTAAGRRWVWTTFGPDQADLDYAEPSLLLEMAGILLEYVGHGAEVLRMDAVTYLWKELGSSGVHHPNTHAVLRIVRSLLEIAAPWVVVLTETNVPHQENLSYFGQGDDEAQMVYNFALPTLMAHTAVAHDTSALTTWARGLRTPGPSTWLLNFLASHDGIGLRSAEGLLAPKAVDRLIERTVRAGGGVGRKRDSDGSDSPYELNVNYFDLLAEPGTTEPLARQVDRFAALHAVAMALPGVPALYLHSLLGSRGSPELASSSGMPRAVNRAKLDHDRLKVELSDPDGRRARVLDALARLLRARRRHPAFDPSAPHQVVDTPPSVFAVRRTGPAGEVDAWHELAGETVTVRLPRGGKNLLSGAPVEAGTHTLAPYQVLWVDPAG